MELSSLQTIMVESKTLLNDRQLTHVSPNLKDPESITPAQW